MRQQCNDCLLHRRADLEYVKYDLKKRNKRSVKMCNKSGGLTLRSTFGLILRCNSGVLMLSAVVWLGNPRPISCAAGEWLSKSILSAECLQLYYDPLNEYFAFFHRIIGYEAESQFLSLFIEFP